MAEKTHQPNFKKKKKFSYIIGQITSKKQLSPPKVPKEGHGIFFFKDCIIALYILFLFVFITSFSAIIVYVCICSEISLSLDLELSETLRINKV